MTRTRSKQKFLKLSLADVYLAAIAILTVISSAACATKDSSPHLFSRDRAVTIALNNTDVPDSRVYRAANIWLIDTGNGSEWYGYVRDDKFLLTCKSPQRIPLGSSIYLLKDVLPCVPFTDVKAFNPHLLVTSQSIEFDSFENRGRVKATWPY